MFVLTISQSNSVTVQCEFVTEGDWWVVQLSLYCDVMNQLKITSADSPAIDKIEGDLPDEKTFDDIQGFSALNVTTRYFPKGLEKFFKNLVMIDINHGRLREIHQSDLAPFPKLKCLDLYENDIEVLEEDLFKFNGDLRMIWLSGNKIFHISSTAFASVTKVTYISFVSNPCISRFVKDNSTVANEIIASAFENCVDEKELEKKFPSLMKTIESIERELIILDEKIENKSLIYNQNEEKVKNFGFFYFILGILIFALLIFVIWKKFYYEKRKIFASRVEFENSNEIY